MVKLNALYARDQQGPKFAFQHLIYPMIDDRTAVRTDLHPYVGEFVWTQENNYFGWRSLLGRHLSLHCETRIHDTPYPSRGHRLIGRA